MSEDKQKCAIYVRSATTDGSPHTQEMECRRYAEQKGWTIADDCVFTDDSTCGNSIGARPGFAGLIEASKQKPSRFETVLVADTARLGRQLSEVLLSIALLEQYGINVCSVGMDSDSKDPNFRLFVIGEARVLARFSRNASQRVQAGLKGRALKGGSTGGRCYGYRAIPATDPNHVTRLEIVDSEAATVGLIFDLFAQGRTTAGIAKTLNAAHTASSSRGSSQWSASAVGRVLRNERYAGVVAYNRTSRRVNPETGRVHKVCNPVSDVLRVPAPHLRIVSEDLWARVQERLESCR